MEDEKQQPLEGIITFVQHDKKFVTIEYEHNGKTKTINGSIKEDTQQKLIEEKLIKKLHHFREGDEVYFQLTRSKRGDKMVAERIRFRYNNSLSNLLHRASISNQFSGYLKQVEDQYFIKEIGSYHFFPLKLATWEKRPFASAVNEPVQFSLENFTNPDKVTAILVRKQYIPEFNKAQLYYDNATEIDATVTRITPHGIYLQVIGDKVKAKLPVEGRPEDIKEKVGDTIKIIITFLSADKITVKRV